MSRLLICFFLMLASVLPSFASQETISASALDLSQYPGRVIYMDFWASWCGPCRESFPWMVSMQEKYAESGLTIIAINVDEDAQQAEQFLHQVQHNFQIVMDPAGQIAERYKLVGMPSSFLIKPDGQILQRHTGFREKDMTELESNIQKALAANAMDTK